MTGGVCEPFYDDLYPKCNCGHSGVGLSSNTLYIFVELRTRGCVATVWLEIEEVDRLCGKSPADCHTLLHLTLVRISR